MIEKKMIVTAKEGLHARPASALAKVSMKFDSKLAMYKGDDRSKAYQPKSVLSIMTSAIGYGQEVTVVAEGGDEVEAITELEALFASGFEG